MTDFKTGWGRYGVTVTAGSHDGKRFAVWDKNERRVASWHRTEAQARAAIKKLKAKEN